MGLAAALVLVLAATLAAGWLLRQGLSRQALPLPAEAFTPKDVERALALAAQHDPRRAIPGVVRILRLSQHEANLLLQHAAARVWPSRWALTLETRQLRLQLSTQLPAFPGSTYVGRWLNLDVRARQAQGLPVLDEVRLGQVRLPLPVVEAALARWGRHNGLWLGNGPGAGDELLSVHQLRLSPQRLELTYAWGENAPARLMASLLPSREHQRLRAYAEHLADWAAAQRHVGDWPLAQLLPPVFDLARRRSAEGQDPALENRAALMVLGMVANGVSLSTLLPERREQLERQALRVTLAGRRDFTQHLLASATLAAERGSSLADLVGLYKELADARSGSGFSFNDMAANRAGARLGALAVTDPARLQQRLAAGLHDDDLLPDVSDLPEFLHPSEFRRRFGSPEDPAYQRLMRDIETRLDRLPLLQSTP